MKPLLALVVLAALPAMAQLPAPNKAGVSAGHDILSAKDPAAATKFWTALGAEPAQLGGRLNLLKFPGLLLLVGGRTPPTGGTEGSSVEFIGFTVKNLKDSLAKWEAAGIKPLPGATATQAFVMAPDEIKVRITENKSQMPAIAADTLQMDVSNAAEAKAWYAKWFGAAQVKHGQETVADIPGTNLLFKEVKEPVAGTKGRAFGRLGLEVKGLEDFCKKLDAGGIKLETPFTKAGGMALAICVITDPWGTNIEISEGLAAVQ